MKTMILDAQIYQQFDADHSRDVPAEAYGGWQTVPVTLPVEHTALVSMHTWYGGAIGEFPGWDRCVEYRPRSYRIMERYFPSLLGAARAAGMPVVHVVGGGNYYKHRPGYQKAVALAGPPPAPPAGAPANSLLDEARKIRARHTFPGEPNQADVTAGFKVLDFGREAMPVGDEYCCEDAHQLNAVCRHLGCSHLVYVGFAINWCLLMSPGGMLDMSRLGYTCSAIRECVTAVECKESARNELHKAEGLWRTALSFGFVFRVDPFIQSLRAARAG